MTVVMALDDVTSILPLKDVMNTCKRMQHSPTIGGISSWQKLKTSNVFSSFHYGNRSVRNLIYTGLLSADRRLPYISDNDEVGTSINFIKTEAVV